MTIREYLMLALLVLVVSLAIRENQDRTRLDEHSVKLQVLMDLKANRDEVRR